MEMDKEMEVFNYYIKDTLVKHADLLSTEQYTDSLARADNTVSN